MSLASHRNVLPMGVAQPFVQFMLKRCLCVCVCVYRTLVWPNDGGSYGKPRRMSHKGWAIFGKRADRAALQVLAYAMQPHPSLAWDGMGQIWGDVSPRQVRGSWPAAAQLNGTYSTEPTPSSRRVGEGGWIPAGTAVYGWQLH